MDAHANLFRTALAALLLASASPALADTVFRCQDELGTPVFSDLPCAEERPADATRLALELHNIATGMALGEADHRHLEAIDARRPTRASVSGLADPEREAHCEAVRAEREALRRAARKGHDGSALAARRALRKAIRDACH